MNKKYVLFIIVVVILLILLPFLGIKKIHFSSLFKQGEENFILWHFRIPRILLGFIAGGCFALIGLITQNLFKNHLATPEILGVSSGAAAGTVLAIHFGVRFIFLGINGTSIFGVLGGLLAIGLIFFVLQLIKDKSIFSILMIGLSLNLFFSSLIVLLQYFIDFSNVFSILHWLMGALIINGYREVIFCSIVLILLFVFLMIFSKELVLLSTGDEFCLSKGLNIYLFRLFVLVIICISISMLVSITGPIGFISLVVPHISRIFSGYNFRLLVINTFFIGAFFLIISDFIARNLLYPVEIPVGIITSFLGAPFFLYILVRYLKRNV